MTQPLQVAFVLAVPRNFLFGLVLPEFLRRLIGLLADLLLVFAEDSLGNLLVAIGLALWDLVSAVSLPENQRLRLI